METGKVEYAPDYKSEKSSGDVTVALTGVTAKAEVGDMVAMTSFEPVALLKQPSELQRLEREVIEAAKAEREANKEYLMRLNFITSEVHHAALMRRTEAVDALLAFESSQQQIKK